MEWESCSAFHECVSQTRSGDGHQTVKTNHSDVIENIKAVCLYLFEPLQQRGDRETVGDGRVVLGGGLRVEQRKLQKRLEAVLGEVFPEPDAAGAVVAQRHRRVDRSFVEKDHDLPNEVRRNLAKTTRSKKVSLEKNTVTHLSPRQVIFSVQMRCGNDSFPRKKNKKWQLKTFGNMKVSNGKNKRIKNTIGSPVKFKERAV